MQELKLLNARQRKVIYKQLEEQFGVTERLPYLHLENTKDKVFLLSPDYQDLNLKGLRINNKALYFGKRGNDGFRLSIEGAQLVKATKNVVSLTKEQVDRWMQGEDNTVEHERGYVVVKYKKDILGCARIVNNILRNMVPKERRLHSVSN